MFNTWSEERVTWTDNDNSDNFLVLWQVVIRPYSADYSHLVRHVPCGWILSQHWHKIHVVDLLQSAYPFVGHMMESSSITRSYSCTEIWSQIITNHWLSRCCSCSNYRAKTNCILATVIHIKMCIIESSFEPTSQNP